MREDLRIRVIIEGQFGEVLATAIAPLSSDLGEVVKSLKTSDGPCPFFDTPMETVHRVREMRNYTVQNLSPKIADVLIEAMRAKDTVNGYTKAGLEEFNRRI